jgi:ABC-type dipeptide/oligopeptide/nickel transport system permease subunit
MFQGLKLLPKFNWMKRLFKFHSFTLGFVIIVIFIIPAIPGYLITTDSTTDANDIVSQITNKPPGFECDFIRISNNNTPVKENYIQIWMHGQKLTGTAIPIRNIITKTNDSIWIKPIDDNISMAYPLASVEKINNSVIQHRKFTLGTDRFGRDLLSRLILGARVSLFVGFVSVIISLILGTSIGLFAGYIGGRTDSFLSWIISVFWSVPTLLIALGLSFVFGKGLNQMLVAIGLSTWVEVARVVRGQTMQLREKEFILAARITGFSTLRILFKHILPNLKGSLTVLATTNFAAAILLEAGLSFLGLGISPPAPSWGIMVKEHMGNLVLDSAYLAIVPGVSIMLLVMGFNFMSMGLRDAFDNRLNTTN